MCCVLREGSVQMSGSIWGGPWHWDPLGTGSALCSMWETKTGVLCRNDKHFNLWVTSWLFKCISFYFVILYERDASVHACMCVHVCVHVFMSAGVYLLHTRVISEGNFFVVNSCLLLWVLGTKLRLLGLYGKNFQLLNQQLNPTSNFLFCYQDTLFVLSIS